MKIRFVIASEYQSKHKANAINIFSTFTVKIAISVYYKYAKSCAVYCNDNYVVNCGFITCTLCTLNVIKTGSIIYSNLTEIKECTKCGVS